MAVSYSCKDFMGFQEAIKKMRDMDDKIIYALNQLPTDSFRGQVNSEKTCRDLYARLQSGHKEREQALKSCIVLSAETVKALREKRDSSADDVDVNRAFKSEQRKLHILQAELNVEDIVKERSYKAFNERCRTFFQAGSAGAGAGDL